MAKVEITDNTIIRSLVRKGTDNERQTITLEEGELGYTTDSKRLVIGTSDSSIGESTGTKFLGNLQNWPIGLNPLPGDFFVKDNKLYCRGKEFFGNKETDLLNDPAGYVQLGISNGAGSGLTVNNDTFSVAVDNNTIVFDFEGKLKVGSIDITNNVDNIAGNTLLGRSGPEGSIQTLSVNTNSVLGRKNNDPISNVSFSDIVSIGNQSFSQQNPYNNNNQLQQIGASVVNTDYSGSVTWAGLPHLEIGYSSGTFNVPANCGLVKIMLQGAGSNGDGQGSGSAGGFLMFYAAVSPGSQIIYTIGNNGYPSAGNSEVTFTKYDSATYTYTAQGGQRIGYPVNHNGPANIYDEAGALGNVLSITQGVYRNNNVKDRQPRMSSYFGNNGPGSGGMDSDSSGDFTGNNGVIIIEYYQPI